MHDNEILYTKFVFTNDEKRKEWENTDDNLKRFILNKLQKNAESVQTSLSIEILSNAIVDLQERIERLERKINEQSDAK